MKLNQYRLCRTLITIDMKNNDYYHTSSNEKYAAKRLRTIQTIVYREDRPSVCACLYLYGTGQHCCFGKCHATTIEIDLKDISDINKVMYYYIRGRFA
jgi:hypothetical protein